MGENNLIVYVNKTPCSRAEWQNVFDYELIGECDQWVKFLGDEFAKKEISKSTTPRVLIPFAYQAFNTSKHGNIGNSVITQVKEEEVDPHLCTTIHAKGSNCGRLKAAEISEISITPSLQPPHPRSAHPAASTNSLHPSG